MKNKSVIIVLIVILSCMVILLTGGFIFLLNNNFNFNLNFNASDIKLIESTDIESNSIDNIKLYSYNADIEIKESDNDIRVEYYSNSEKNPKIIKNDNEIILDERNYDMSCFGFCFINRRVVLYIPSDYDGKFDIETVSGDIYSNINIVNDISMTTTSGDIELLEVNDISVVTTSGDIKVSKTNKISAVTTSGDVTINRVNERVSVKTTSGDIILKNLDIKDNSSVETASGDVSINNNISNCYVETSTTSGDTNISKSDRKSDLILKIKTTSGDITVN